MNDAAVDIAREVLLTWHREGKAATEWQPVPPDEWLDKTDDRARAFDLAHRLISPLEAGTNPCSPAETDALVRDLAEALNVGL
jgi:hypothetical protein